MIDPDKIARAMAGAPKPHTWADGPARIRIEVDTELRQFQVTVPPRETETVAKVFGSWYDGASGVWTMPARPAQLWQLARLFQGRTDASPQVHALADMWAEHAERQEAVRSTELVADPEDSRKAHQIQGVQFLVGQSGLLADEPGLGKTLQAIDWMRLTHSEGRGIYLVATTNSTKLNWELEIQRWWPLVPVVVLSGTPAARRKQLAAVQALDAEGRRVVLVVGHAQLALHSKLQPLPGRSLSKAAAKPKELNDMRFAAMVIDEAHKIRGYDTSVRQAAAQLGTQAEYRLALTGTPKERSDDDLWSVMSWVDPENWGTRAEYREMYCTLAEGWGGKTNLGIKPGLRPEVDRLLMPYYLRRTKDILPGLPEKWPMQWRIVELTKPQRQLYDALMDSFGAVVNGNVLIEANAATLQGRLLQVACAMPVVDDEGNVTELALPSTKVEVILDILDEGGDEPLVVYTQSRKFAELIDRSLRDKGYTTGMITGMQTDRQRQATVQGFQAGDLQVAIGTIGAGAEGITLHRANRIVLAQLDWLASRNEQAIDRVHRIGQSRGVQPIAIVAADTVDVTKAMVHLGRLADAQSLLRDPGRFEEALRGTWDLVTAIREAGR